MEIKSQEHLIDIILNRNEEIPNYALFLGAGASWNSNVKTADELVKIWREQLYQRNKTRMKYSTWLKKQSWYNTDGEYAHLFEFLYDEPSQRRDYIENILKFANPSWGYVYLASLLQSEIWNTVFTTNFDDLINEACYLYTDRVRPIVCAHDSEVSNIRITRRRAKIIKLHGDFLFDSIKNTNIETRRLTKNMEMKLSQFGQEYGLVVIGYGGRDNSVMSILEKLLTNKDYFKHGIYWCICKGEDPRTRVKKLLEKDKVHGIEIEGFDEFMAALHNKAGLDLPASVINPMEVAEQRSKIFCSVPKQLYENKIIRKDIERVLDGLGKIKKKVKGKYVPPEELPRKLKAAIMKRRGDLNSASEYMKLEATENKDDPFCAFDYADILAKLGKIPDLKEFVPSSAIEEENKTYFMLFMNDDNQLIDKATKLLQKEPSSMIARINRAIAYKRLGKMTEMEKDLVEIEEREPDESLKAGIAALRKDKKKMLSMLSAVVDKGLLSTEHIKMFPVFEDYRDDQDFKKFIKDREKIIGK